MEQAQSVIDLEKNRIIIPDSADAIDTLQGRDEYAGYFAHLKRVFTLLVKTHEQLASKGHFETEIIKSFLDKFLFTIDLLRLKHLYNPDRPLNLDLTESGFPHSLDILNLDVDLDLARQKLIALPSEPILTQAILDYLFEFKKEPTELLLKMANVKYLTMLDENKMFKTFIPGKLERRQGNGGDGRKVRNYVFSWGCYDSGTNRPYIHVLFFDQSERAKPLEEDRLAFDEFLELIRSEGSRVPDVGILAMSIDQSLATIHPKVLKRIGIGPVYGRYSRDDNEITHYLKSHKSEADDFVLFFSTSIIFSAEERVSQGLFSRGKIRQVFYIPESDEDCYANKASKIHRYALAPHRVIQGMSLAKDQEFGDAFGREVITCNEREEINAR